MIERLTRSDRSRFDDNPDNIKRRIETFQKTTSEVIDSFRSRSKSYYRVRRTPSFKKGSDLVYVVAADCVWGPS